MFPRRRKTAPIQSVQQRNAEAPRTSLEKRPSNGVSLEKLISELEDREVQLKKRIEAVELQILHNGRQMRAARPGSDTEGVYKQRAMQYLRQKRLLERRVENTTNRVNLLQKALLAKEEASYMEELQAFARHDRIDAQTALRELDGIRIQRHSDDVMEKYSEIMGDISEVNQVLAGDFAQGAAEDHEIEEELNSQMENEFNITSSSVVNDIPEPNQDIPDEPSALHPFTDMDEELSRIRSELVKDANGQEGR